MNREHGPFRLCVVHLLVVHTSVERRSVLPEIPFSHIPSLLLIMPTTYPSAPVLLFFYLSGTCPLLPSLELSGIYSSDDYRGLSSSGEVPDHSSEGSYVHTDRPEDIGTE